MKFTAILAAALLAQQSIAHPGQSKAELQKEVEEQKEYFSTHKRTLADCADKLQARGNDALLQARRAAKVEALRKKRSISTDKPMQKVRRTFEDVLATDHQSNLTVTPETATPDVIFAGNASCLLTPETTEGPYWVQGELIREDLVEDEEGVPLTLDIQMIDINTCEPIPQAYMEIWACNSTGVYSGVVHYGNGNTDDTSNLDNTALRGVQPTDADGVAGFNTLFPGHYIGRATHIHILTHLEATVLPNNTVTGGTVNHVGQIFFDQDLITEVEKQEVYAQNTQVLTTNAEDDIMKNTAANVDPVVEYVLLGDDVSEGIFGWISFGVDPTAAKNTTVVPAVYLTEEGGVENPNQSDWQDE